MAINFKKTYEDFKETLKTTSIEALILAMLGASAVGLFFHNIEYQRSKKIPLGFSEITQIETDALCSGKKVGSLTRYLTSVNDTAMKIFECWNLSHSNFLGNKEAIFAKELEYKMDPALKIHHHELFEFLRDLPKQAEDAKAGLNDFIKTRGRLVGINSHFDNSWNDRHSDNYRPQVNIDGKGNVYITEVYDDTTHSYTYNGEEGEKASKSLDSLLAEQKTLELQETIFLPSQTNAEGEYAAEKSRKTKKGTRLDRETLLEIASRWNKGSTLMLNLPVIYEMWKNLHSDADEWREAKNTAHSTSYNTGSRQDDGPKEFQIAEGALNHGEQFKTSIDEIVKGIDYVQENAPVLDNKVREYIAVVLDRKPGDANKLRAEIMYSAREFYKINFKRGFDTKAYRIYMVFLGALLGLTAGGLAGVGVDKMADNYGWWDPKEHRVKNFRR